MSNYEYNYFQTWQLQFLTRFMFDSTPMIIKKSDVAFADTQPQADQLYEVIKAVTSLKFEGGRKVFDDCDYSKDTVVIKLNNGINSTYIEKHLKSYIKAFEQNEIISNDKQELSFKQNLINFCNLIKQGYNYKDFKLKEWKYLPVVLYGYFSKSVYITDISLKLPYDMDKKQETFAISDLIGESLDIPIFNDEFLDFNCKLDVTKFVEKHVSSDNSSKKGKCKLNTLLRKDKKFSKQQREILAFIIKSIDMDIYDIPTADFYMFLNKPDINADNENMNNAVARAIYKLNEQFKQRFNTNYKIVTKGQLSATYSITETFKMFVEDNYNHISMILK